MLIAGSRRRLRLATSNIHAVVINEVHICGEHCVHLTQSQRRIVQLVAMGMSNKEIAAQQGKAVTTIRNQLSALYRILQVQDRTQLAIAALKAGLLT